MLRIIAQTGTGDAGVGGSTGEVIHYTLEQVVSPYLWIFLVSFLVVVVITPVVRWIALKNGIVDWPDLKRKAHLEPVAYLGGVAIFIGWLAGAVLSYFIQSHASSDANPMGVIFPPSLIIGAFIITLVGAIDDIYGISPRVKVGGQLIAAALLAELRIGDRALGMRLAGGTIEILCNYVGIDPSVIPNFGSPIPYYDPAYWLGAVIIALLVLGGCNAMNLLDGLDGLASGVTAIVAMGFTFMSVYLAMGYYGATGAYSPVYDPWRLTLAVTILGVALGFLPWNFNPAVIFMGDAGSLLLGYLCMSMVLLFAEKSNPGLVAAALTIFALPMIDTTLAIVRRKIRHQPIFSPDNQHLHHQLIRSGLGVKRSVLVLYVIAGGFAVMGCAMVLAPIRFVMAVFIVFCAFVLVMAYKVGHKQYLAMQQEAASKAEAAVEPTAETEPKAERNINAKEEMVSRFAATEEERRPGKPGH